MSINLIPFPNPAPIGISDWEEIIDVTEALSLGINNPADYDFSGDTIKQGVVIQIGGSVYQTTVAEAITGTPSDYVRITPAGSTATALYVASLAGVTWNSVYNFYQDGSGYAYLFNEAKENLTSPKTVIGKFAKDAYIEQLTTTGQTILARDGGTVDIYNDINLTASKGINLGSSDFRIDSGGVGNRAIVIENTNAAVDAHVYIRAGVSGGVLMNDSNDSSLFLGRGAFTSAPRLVVATSVGDLPTFSANTVALFQNNDSASLSSIVTILGGETGASYLYFGDKDLQNPGSLFYLHSTNSLNWSTDATFAMRLTADNKLLVNTTSELANLTVDGDMRIIGTTHPFIVKATGFLDDTWMDGILFVDTITEKTAIAGITIPSEVTIQNKITVTDKIEGSFPIFGTWDMSQYGPFNAGGGRLITRGFSNAGTTTGNDLHDTFAPFLVEGTTARRASGTVIFGSSNDNSDILIVSSLSLSGSSVIAHGTRLNFTSGVFQGLTFDATSTFTDGSATVFSADITM